MKTLRLHTLLLSVMLTALVCAQPTGFPTQWLMPKPQDVVETRTTFSLQRPVFLNDPTSSTLLASLFETAAEAEATVTVKLVDDAALGTFDYVLPGFPNEGYKLSVSANTIHITAASKTGVIRAAQTLAQLAAATDGAYIHGLEMTDYPAFKLRGFMHDVGRSFISFEELKKEIDLLSRFKVNVFHWHLTDNQGFRFESKVFPQLNSASSMTRFAGQYYTQEQCTELEAYAAERGLIIIPEIDMPGHSTAFTNAMGYTMSSEQGRAALKQLLAELAAAFPLAPYIHMGADEAGTTAAFVNEMSQYIKQTLGRRCIVWNPISGVSISTATLPYIDMTEMWSTSGRKISGLPNIDCRYNYVNHFDVFADLVGIYKSNIYYAKQGNSELAGAITALWNDRKTPTERDIISQNSLYANALATAERGWIGGGKQYIETGGTTLPTVGSEYDEFADWERRFLHYKDTWLSGEPIPYVRQTNVRWRITDPFPNYGDPDMVFPPEEAKDDILPTTFTYNGTTYGTAWATGAGIYLRHTWGTTVPSFFSSPQSNTTAYAWTYVYSPKAQTVGALIEFQNYSRSENDRAPDAGQWDRKGSHIYLNGQEILPPTWTNSGKSINSEVDLGNENFPAREPVSVQLQQGWNKVFLKLPYVAASGVRLNKWMFTFVLTTPDGRQALDGIVYSPTKTMRFEDEDIPRLLSSTPLPELEGKTLKVSSSAAADLTTGQWYVMYDRGNGRGYLWENVGTHTLFNTATPPSSALEDNARFLVRLVDAPNGKYYLQTGFGNYFGKIQQSTNVPLTANPTEAIVVAKINATDGHFYLQSAAGYILDANDYSQGDAKATVVGWGTSVPTSLNGNNDWAFYPVELTDPQPEPSNVVKIVYENTMETSLGKWDIDNTSGRNIWTSTSPANPIAGLTLTKSAGTFDRYTGWNGYYNLAYKVEKANRDERLTLTAPDGYLISSYTLQAQQWSNGAAADDFTLTAEDGTTVQPAYGGPDGYTLFYIKDILRRSTYFIVRSTDASKYLAVINFTVTLIPEGEVGISNPLSALNTQQSATYNLAGQCIAAPTTPGIYVRDGRKVLVH